MTIGKLDAMRERHKAEERQLLRKALAEADWKVGRAAAEALGVPLSSLKYLVDHDAELLAEWKKKRSLAVVKGLAARVGRDQKRLEAARRELGT